MLGGFHEREAKSGTNATKERQTTTTFLARGLLVYLFLSLDRRFSKSAREDSNGWSMAIIRAGSRQDAKKLRLLQQFVVMPPILPNFQEQIPCTSNPPNLSSSSPGIYPCCRSTDRILQGISGLCPCSSSQAKANRTISLLRPQLRSTSCKELADLPATENKPRSLAF
jgi:hypothetical protein